MADRALGQASDAPATRQYNAAAELQNRGQFDAAAQEWAKFIDTYRNDARVDVAFHHLGVCYLKAGKLDLARQCFEILVKHRPNSELIDSAYYCLGSTYFRLGRDGKPGAYAAAANAFRTVIDEYPRSKYVADALFNCGESFYHQGKRSQAVAMYERLVAEFPRHDLAASAQYALGVSLEELSRYDEAGKSYDAFLEKYPKNRLAAEVTVRRGETLLAQGQFEAAAKRFATAAGVPGFALADHATVRQAEAMVRLKKYAEAAALYDSVRAKWPKSKLVGVAGLAGGKCHYLAGNYAAARRSLEAAAAAGGDAAPEAAHWLVRTILKQGKPADAAATAAKLLARFGDDPQVIQLMMDRADAVYDTPNRRAESIALYAALASKYPNDAVAPRALYMAGFAALGTGDNSAALKHSVGFLTAYPNNDLAADAAYVAAESRLQLGQYAAADKGFADLVAKHPDHPDIEMWRVRRVLSRYLQKKYAQAIQLVDSLVAGDLHTPGAIAEAQYLAARKPGGIEPVARGGSDVGAIAGYGAAMAAGRRNPAAIGPGVRRDARHREGQARAGAIDSRFAPQPRAGSRPLPACRVGLRCGRLCRRGRRVPASDRQPAAEPLGRAGPLRAGLGQAQPERLCRGREVF